MLFHAISVISSTTNSDLPILNIVSTNIKASIIIPVYKVPLEYLRECFDSLIIQAMQDCEFIVVSDGAPDAECAICVEYAEKDSRFRFFQKKHAGVSAARNYGLQKAYGEYISFLDSDDFLSRDALTLFAKNINNSDILLANTQLFWNISNKKTLLKLSNTFGKKIEIQKIPNFAICGYLFKKSILDKYSIIFDESLKLSEDRVFIYTYLTKAKQITTLENTVYYYRQHSNSVCHQPFSTDNILQQFYATAQINQILEKVSKIKSTTRLRICGQYIRAALIGYFKSNECSKSNKRIIRGNFKNISKSKIFFFYCWYRAFAAAIIGKLLHL